MEEFKYLKTILLNQIPFGKKLSAYGSEGIIVIIWCRSFVLKFAIQKYKD